MQIPRRAISVAAALTLSAAIAASFAVGTSLESQRRDEVRSRESALQSVEQALDNAPERDWTQNENLRKAGDRYQSISQQIASEEGLPR